MQKAAEYTTNLLNQVKQNKISAPFFLVVVSWLVISFLLYPQNTPSGEVKGISDSTITQPTPKEIGIPTPTLFILKNTNSFNKHSYSYARVDSQASINATASSQTSSSTPNKNSSIASSNNTFSTQSSSPTNTPVNDNNPPPTLSPAPISGTENSVVSPTPIETQAPTENNTALGNTLSTLVRTIISAAPSH